ncbi:MAG: hypothetical protein ACJAR2_003904 [Ilumatobacter sp.]|jgi:hypothetical protein
MPLTIVHRGEMSLRPRRGRAGRSGGSGIECEFGFVLLLPIRMKDKAPYQRLTPPKAARITPRDDVLGTHPLSNSGVVGECVR